MDTAPAPYGEGIGAKLRRKAMQSSIIWNIAMIPWYAFGAYWLITALRVKRTKARERSLDRFLTVVVVVAAYTLLFSRWMRIGLLRVRFLPSDPWIAYLGIALSFLGAGISIWARYCIGEYWSARVTLKEDHRLIRSGPYAYVRHPIYTGMLIACIGTSLVVGEWRGVLAVGLLLAAHSRKAMREEAMLTREFGEQYTSYRQSTGFLFPRLLHRPGMGTPASHS
jgi:protein-S-isoprenylcysteine O-methyltransferase Ste14